MVGTLRTYDIYLTMLLFHLDTIHLATIVIHETNKNKSFFHMFNFNVRKKTTCFANIVHHHVLTEMH